jgi:UDP-GlcNAc:undecaprenyl-phosphate GlcNAc-1-phosphate transferase
VPLAICAIPALDAGAALVRRVITGQSVFTADRGHLHHALLLRGWSTGQTVAFISGLTTITCGAALASYFLHSDWIAIPITFAVFVALAATRIFGHAESALVFDRMRSIARQAVRGPLRRAPIESESAIRVQGHRQWQNLWAALREAAPVHRLAAMTLRVNMPQYHEAFYANWKHSEHTASENCWKISLPLTFESHTIGKLDLVGSSGGREALVDMQQLFDFLEMLDVQIAEIVEDVAVEFPGVPKGSVSTKEVESVQSDGIAANGQSLATGSAG